MNVYYYKVTKLDIQMFWKNIGKMTVIPSAMVILGIWICYKSNHTSWGILILEILVYTFVYSLSMYFIVMNNYEKDVVRKPILKLLGKINKWK